MVLDTGLAEEVLVKGRQVSELGAEGRGRRQSISMV